MLVNPYQNMDGTHISKNAPPNKFPHNSQIEKSNSFEDNKRRSKVLVRASNQEYISNLDNTETHRLANYLGWCS